jgi:hypothetical protein
MLEVLLYDYHCIKLAGKGVGGQQDSGGLP